MTDSLVDDFALSRMVVESLPYPKDSVFQSIKKYFPHLQLQGLRPPEDPRAWKALRQERRHEELARALAEGGRLTRFFLVCGDTLLLGFVDVAG